MRILYLFLGLVLGSVAQPPGSRQVPGDRREDFPGPPPFARRLNRVQLSAFKKLGPLERPYGYQLVNF